MRTLLRIGTVAAFLLLPAPLLANPILIGTFYAQEDFPFLGELTFSVTNESEPTGFGGLFSFTIELHTDAGLVDLATVPDLSADVGLNIHDALADFVGYQDVLFATLIGFQFSQPGNITYQRDGVDVTSPQIAGSETVSIFFEPAAAVPDSATNSVLLTALGALGAFYFRCKHSS